MTGEGDGGDNRFDVEDVRLAMHQACYQYLHGTNYFTPELLAVLCSTYMLVNNWAGMLEKQKMPGIKAAEFLGRLRAALPDQSEAELKKMTARHFNVTMDALNKALQRKRSPTPTNRSNRRRGQNS